MPPSRARVLMSAAARLHRSEPTVALIVQHVLTATGTRGCCTDTAAQIAARLGRTRRSIESALHRAYSAGTLAFEQQRSGCRHISPGRKIVAALRDEAVDEAVMPPHCLPHCCRCGCWAEIGRCRLLCT